MELNQEKIQEAVVQQIASDFAEYESLATEVNREITSRLDKLFKERVEDIIHGKINAMMEDGFNHEYQKIDTFGRPNGEPTTVAKELERLISNYWTQRVNSKSGKPTEDSYNSISRAEFVILQACGEGFAKDLKQNAINVVGQLKDGLRAELKAWTDRTLNELFKVNSADDQAKKRAKKR